MVPLYSRSGTRRDSPPYGPLGECIAPAALDVLAVDVGVASDGGAGRRPHRSAGDDVRKMAAVLWQIAECQKICLTKLQTTGSNQGFDPPLSQAVS